MGAKTSKSEQLTRRKSFTNLGRSSQRSLFQKSKVKLNRIAKQIDSTEVGHSDVAAIRNDLDVIDKELNGISDAVKAKNQEKYDEACRQLQNTRKKYEDKFSVHEEPLVIDEANEIVLRNAAVETPSDSPEESKKASVTFTEVSEEAISYSEEPKKPSVKFGVQVLPPSPQISQVLIKRKTYPANSPPRNDLINRNTTDGGFPQNGTFSKMIVQTSSSFSSTRTGSQNEETNSVLIETSSKKEYIKSNLLLGIEAINDKVNELENKLKYFTGSRDSKKYIELHEGLINSLAFLDRFDTDEDSIAKQEKRILRQRINELLKILECLVEEIGDDCEYHSLPPNEISGKMEQRPKLSSVTAI